MSVATRDADPQAQQGRLPAQLSPLVGRGDQLRELTALLETERLVTLTGPGGAGKSRLAVAVATKAMSRFPGGVHWVPLATLDDPARLAYVVADAIGVSEQAGTPVLDSLVAALTDGRTLLVCDNCEHVLDEFAVLAERLLGSCPGLSILATSQQRVNIQPELNWPIPPLAVPGENEADVTRYESVRLFVERARGALAGFTLKDEDAEAVGRICRRLDGIPLAIELAACRVNVLTVRQIDARLDSCMQVLVGGSRTASPRHRAIQATMDWSYRLLEEPERRLFARLSVLSGTFGLGAVEALAGQYIDNPLDVLAALVAKSLVVALEHPTGMRYRQLRVVREYARSKLVERGESLATQAEHARFFVTLAERAEQAAAGPQQRACFDRLHADRENLRAAHDWCVHGGWVDGALRLACATWRFCVLRGHYRDGRQWLEDALPVAGRAPAGLRARALVAAGRLAHLECDYDIALRRLTDGLALHSELGDESGVATALEVLGSVARERARYTESIERHHRSLELAERRADQLGVARALNYLAFACWLNGDHTAAVRHASRARTIFAGAHDPEGIVWSLLNLGSAALYQGGLAEAGALLCEALTVATDASYPEGVAWSLNQLGALAERLGDQRRAEGCLLESLRIHQSLGDRWRMTSVLEALATTAIARDNAAEAVSLLAAAAMLRESIDAPVPPAERTDVERTKVLAQAALGPDRFDQAWAEGTAAAPRTVIERVLDDERDSPAPPFAVNPGVARC